MVRTVRALAVLAATAAGLAVVLQRHRWGTPMTLSILPLTYASSHSPLLSSEVFPLNSTALMPLAAKVVFRADENALSIRYGPRWSIRAAVRYTPAVLTSLDALWSSAVSLSDDGRSSDEVMLVRLRANTTYSAETWVTVGLPSAAKAPILVANTTFQTSALGYRRFDNGPYVSPTLGTATFEVGTFAAFELDLAAHNGTNLTKTFNGLVGIDAEGYVVWAYHMDGAEAWDFLPHEDGGGILLAGKGDHQSFEISNNGSARHSTVPWRHSLVRAALTWRAIAGRSASLAVSLLFCEPFPCWRIEPYIKVILRDCQIRTSESKIGNVRRIPFRSRAPLPAGTGTQILKCVKSTFSVHRSSPTRSPAQGGIETTIRCRMSAALTGEHLGCRYGPRSMR